MKTEYQYLTFDKTEKQPVKTSKWNCRNRKSQTILGEIKWHSAWRQYCYFPTVQAVYSDDCLKDISDFIKQLKEYHKEGK